MKRIIISCLCLLFWGALYSPPVQGLEPQQYIIEEGRGIQSVASLGESIEAIYRRWGKPERIAKEDYITDKFNEYRKRGVLITSDKDGKIISMTFYCNTGNKENLHKTGLAWINPSSIYSTFSGKTTKGLTLKDKLKPKDVYQIYGKPKLTYQLGKVDDIRVVNKKGIPYIYDMGKAGYTINYPSIGLSFETHDVFIESVSIHKND